ncbi:MAG: PH domain-containing protein [Solirubrobacteraceae bacterium]|nr:PH domain-containing protein [Solirubrobacteraceae bacterium]
MELHEGETILFEGHPSWRSALLFFVKGFLGALVVAAIVWFAVSEGAGIAVGIAGAALTIGISILLRSATEYVITDERLHIRRGIISRTIQETRLGRVQNVTISQTIWERLLQIGKADFDTASEEQADFLFGGIANPDEVRAAVDKAHRLAEQRGKTEGL